MSLQQSLNPTAKLWFDGRTPFPPHWLPRHLVVNFWQLRPIPPKFPKRSQELYDRGEGTWTLELDQKAHTGSSTVSVSDWTAMSWLFSSKLGGKSSLFQISQGTFFMERLPCSWSDEGSSPVSFPTHPSFPHCVYVFWCNHKTALCYMNFILQSIVPWVSADFTWSSCKLHLQGYDICFTSLGCSASP